MNDLPPSTPVNGYQLAASVIATLLVLAGSWLSAQVGQPETSLEYEYSDIQVVGNISTWAFQVKNTSDDAIETKITLPQKHVLMSQFEPASSNRGFWKGELLRGANVKVLIVIDDADLHVSSAGIRSLISGSYQDKDAQTGQRIWQKSVVREARTVTLPNAAIKLAIFFLPLTLGTLAYLAWSRWHRLQKPK